MKNFDEFFLSNLTDLKKEVATKNPSSKLQNQEDPQSSPKKVMTLADYKEQIKHQHSKPLAHEVPAQNPGQIHTQPQMASGMQQPGFPSSMYYGNYPVMQSQFYNQQPFMYPQTAPAMPMPMINPPGMVMPNFYSNTPVFPTSTIMFPGMGISSQTPINLTHSEETYYRKLYSTMPDRQLSGDLPAKKVVDFLKTSNLPKEKLKQFWLALNKPANRPDIGVSQSEFFLLLKMISLEQNKIEPTPQSLMNPGFYLLPVFHNVEEEDAFETFQVAEQTQNEEDFGDFEHGSPLVNEKAQSEKKSDQKMHSKNDLLGDDAFEEVQGFDPRKDQTKMEPQSSKLGGHLNDYDKYNVFDEIQVKKEPSISSLKLESHLSNANKNENKNTLNHFPNLAGQNPKNVFPTENQLSAELYNPFSPDIKKKMGLPSQAFSLEPEKEEDFFDFQQGETKIPQIQGKANQDVGKDLMDFDDLQSPAFMFEKPVKKTDELLEFQEFETTQGKPNTDNLLSHNFFQMGQKEQKNDLTGFQSRNKSEIDFIDYKTVETQQQNGFFQKDNNFMQVQMTQSKGKGDLMEFQTNQKKNENDFMEFQTNQNKNDNFMEFQTNQNNNENDFMEFQTNQNNNENDFMEFQTNQKKNENDLMGFPTDQNKNENDFKEFQTNQNLNENDFMEFQTNQKKNENDFMEFQTNQTKYNDIDLFKTAANKQNNDFMEFQTSNKQEENDFLDFQSTQNKADIIGIPVSSQQIQGNQPNLNNLFLGNQKVNLLDPSHQNPAEITHKTENTVTKGNVFEIDWPEGNSAIPHRTSDFKAIETHIQTSKGDEGFRMTTERNEEDFEWVQGQPEIQSEKPRLVTKKTEDLMDFGDDEVEFPERQEPIKSPPEGNLSSGIESSEVFGWKESGILRKTENLLETNLISSDFTWGSPEGFGTVKKTDSEHNKNLLEFGSMKKTESENIKDVLEGNVSQPQAYQNSNETSNNHIKELNIAAATLKNSSNENPDLNEEDEFEWNEAPKNSAPLDVFQPIQVNPHAVEEKKPNLVSSNSNEAYKFDEFDFKWNEDANNSPPKGIQANQGNLPYSYSADLQDIFQFSQTKTSGINLLDLLSHVENLIPPVKILNLSMFTGSAEEISDLAEALFSLEMYEECEALVEHHKLLLELSSCEVEKKRLIAEERYEDVITIRDKAKKLEKQLLPKERIEEIKGIYESSNGKTFSSICLDRLTDLEAAENLIEMFKRFIEKTSDNLGDLKTLKEIRTQKNAFVELFFKESLN